LREFFARLPGGGRAVKRGVHRKSQPKAGHPPPMTPTVKTDAYEEIAPADRPALPGLVLICDHASNNVPPEIGDLGLPAEDMARHIAFDIGVRGVTFEMARRLGAPAVLSTVSRLVIDHNRHPADPTLIMRLYDGSIIPGNARVGAEEAERRLVTYHAPYHAAIRRVIDAQIAAGHEPVLVSIHSFTPQLRGRPPRPWHAGVLWDRDRRLAGPLLDALAAHTALCIGDNQPYTGRLGGDTMWTHGTQRGLPHALIEIRNDLISDVTGQTEWAALLSDAVPNAIAAMHRAAAE